MGRERGGLAHTDWTRRHPRLEDGSRPTAPGPVAPETSRSTRDHRSRGSSQVPSPPGDTRLLYADTCSFNMKGL